MSLFANAKVVTAPKSKAKSTKQEIEITGLETVASIDALIKSLTTLQATLTKEVKTAGFDIMYEAASNLRQPDNFKAVEGNASASIEMKKRSSASALTEEEIDLLNRFEIPTGKNVTTQALFGFDPKYANDMRLLEKISKLLEGKVPEDLIIKQEEVSKIVVTDETLSTAFAKRAPKEIIEAITVMAIKPKLEVTDIPSIMEMVKDLIA